MTKILIFIFTLIFSSSLFSSKSHGAGGCSNSESGVAPTAEKLANECSPITDPSELRRKRAYIIWKSKYAHDYISHGVGKNAQAVIQDGYLRPAESILRQKGSVIYEKQDSLTSALGTLTISQKEKSLASLEDLPFPCHGVSLAKVKTRADGLMDIYFKRSEEEEWKLVQSQISLSSLNKSILEEKSNNPDSKSRAYLGLILALTGSSTLPEARNKKVPESDYPILNCAIDFSSTKLDIDFTNFPFGFAFDDFYNFYTKREELRKKYKANQVELSAVIFAYDEMKSNEFDRKMSDMLEKYMKYYKAYLETIDTPSNLLNEKIDTHSSFMWEVIGALRKNYFNYFKLQQDISFQLNGLRQGYGPTYVLVGGAKEKITSRIVRETKGNEYRTLDGFKNGGHSETFDLSSPDVLILGPRSELEPFVSNPKLQIIFTEELAEEDKPLFPLEYY